MKSKPEDKYKKETRADTPKPSPTEKTDHHEVDVSQIILSEIPSPPSSEFPHRARARSHAISLEKKEDIEAFLKNPDKNTTEDSSAPLTNYQHLWEDWDYGPHSI